MSYAQQGENGRRPPLLRLDRYHIVVGLHHNGKPTIWWEDGMSNADARRHLDTLYAASVAYLEEVTQPRPPRDKPTPHYRPTNRPPLPNRIEE